MQLTPYNLNLQEFPQGNKKTFNEPSKSFLRVIENIFFHVSIEF